MDALDLMANQVWAARQSYVELVRDVFEVHAMKGTPEGSHAYQAQLEAFRKRPKGSPGDEGASDENERADDLLTSLPGTRIPGTRSATLHGEGRRKVAVLPLRGGIYPRANMATEYSGGTSLQSWMQDYGRVMANDQAGSIVLHVDSPGGMVNGVAESFGMMMANRGKKPMFAYTDGQMCSAALWLASAADAIFASSTATVGSVGVVATWLDERKAMEAHGVRRIHVVSKNAPLKRGEADNEAWMKALQKNIDDTEAVFIQSLAKGRGVSQKKIISDYGQGSVMVGKRAMEAGMVNGIMSLDVLLGFALEAANR